MQNTKNLILLLKVRIIEENWEAEIHYDYLHIIHELGGDHDAGDEEAVDVKGVDRQRRLAVSEPIEVNVGDDEAGGATICVLEDPLQVGLNGDSGPG